MSGPARALAAFALVATGLGTGRPAVAQADPCAAGWGALLPRLVADDGRVRYGLLAAGAPRAAFDAVLRCVETTDARALRTDRARLAFWLNAYNVLLVKSVLDRPRTTDVLAERDFFFRTPRAVAGTRATLDALENVVLRRGAGPAALRALGPTSLDPRLHAGLYCGAVSCPPLRRVAFTEANVDAELDAAMRAWAGSERFARVAGEAVVFSSLLDWFGPDFDAPTGRAGDYLLRYVPAARPGYARLRAVLAGRTAAEIRAQRGVAFAYGWALAAAR